MCEEQKTNQALVRNILESVKDFYLNGNILKKFRQFLRFISKYKFKYVKTK